MAALKLTVTNGPIRGRSLTLRCSETSLVGRGPQADFVVIDLRMSREHFSIFAAESGWCVKDLTSRHGTFINDQRIQEQFLRQGDVILAGDTQFLVSFFDAGVKAAEFGSLPDPHFDTDASTRQTWTRHDA